MNKKRGKGPIAWIVVAMFFVGMSQFAEEATADPQDWMEKIICDTESAVTSVAIGDADNDGTNEVVVGLWSPDQKAIAYEKSNGVWVEDVIVSAPAEIYAVAIGDCDNDELNEVVVGMVSTTNEVRAYNYVGGIWIEDIIADTPNNVYSLAIGDADNDGANEVVIGLHSSSSEVRTYEKSGGIWVEDVVVDTLTHVRCVAIADCDDDTKEEVIIGMASTTNEVRAYENIGGIWVEDIIADTPTNVHSVAVGDSDNDANTEVVIGIESTTNEVRAYEKSGGIWIEDIIADTPSDVYSIAIGDCDNDGNNEVAIGMVSTEDELRAYEKKDSLWKEDIIADTQMDIFSIAVGDADFDGESEVVIGMWSTINEVRLYEYDEGEITFISHENGDYVKGTICLEVAVTSSVEGIRFYLNDELEHVDSNNPYQYIMDTSELTEDTLYTVKAEGIRSNTPSQSTAIDIIVNNVVQEGDFISVNTLKPSYEPDQTVSVLVGVNSPPEFDFLNLMISYNDPNGNTFLAVDETLPCASQFLVGLPLFSDVLLGTYSLSVSANGYDCDELIWYATKQGTFEVVGSGVHDRLSDMQNSITYLNTTLFDIQTCVNDLQSDLMGLNQTELLSALEYLNQSLPIKIDDLFLELVSVNQSLSFEISNTKTYLQMVLDEINTSLSFQIADLQTITEGFYNSIQADLTEIYNTLSLLEANLTTQHGVISDAIITLNETVAQAPEISMDEILNRINDTIDHIQTLNDDLSIHDTDISAVLGTLIALVEYGNDLTEDEVLDDIAVILGLLWELDSNITSHDSEIKDELDVVSNLIWDLESLGLSELQDRISDLAKNVSQNDATVQEKVTQIDQSINDFKEETDEQLANISESLDELSKLNESIENLDKGDGTTQSGGNAKTKSDEETDSNITIILLLFGVILAIVLLGMMFLFRENRMLKETIGAGPKQVVYAEEEN